MTTRHNTTTRILSQGEVYKKFHMLKKASEQQNKMIKMDTSNPKDTQTWFQILMVVNRKTGKTRTMYLSLATKKFVWDEPPSNAVILTDYSIIPNVKNDTSMLLQRK